MLNRLFLRCDTVQTEVGVYAVYNATNLYRQLAVVSLIMNHQWMVVNHLSSMYYLLLQIYV